MKVIFDFSCVFAFWAQINCKAITIVNHLENILFTKKILHFYYNLQSKPVAVMMNDDMALHKQNYVNPMCFFFTILTFSFICYKQRCLFL